MNDIEIKQNSKTDAMKKPLCTSERKKVQSAGKSLSARVHIIEPNGDNYNRYNLALQKIFSFAYLFASLSTSLSFSHACSQREMRDETKQEDCARTDNSY